MLLAPTFITKRQGEKISGTLFSPLPGLPGEQQKPLLGEKEKKKEKKRLLTKSTYDLYRLKVLQ